MPSNCTGSAGHCCPDVLLATFGLPAQPGLPAGHHAMLITFYRFMPVSRWARRLACWVDRLHAWRAAIGSLPAFHDRLTTEPFSSLILARFTVYCHPDLLHERSSVAIREIIPARLSSDGGKAHLTFPFLFLFATGKSQNPASLYQTLFESANKNIFG